MTEPAEAIEIKLLALPPVEAVVTDLVEVFQQETGYTVTPRFRASGFIRRELEAGERVDAIILNGYEIDELAEQGIVAAGTRTDIARVGVGVAVRRGAPLPDISTPEALKQTLLSARSIVYANPALGRGGAHFEQVVLPGLGITDTVKEKAVLSTGGAAGPEMVARAEAELSVQGISEILLVDGVTLVGPLPGDLQHSFTLSAGLAARSLVPEAVLAFITFLARPSFKPKFAEAGLD